MNIYQPKIMIIDDSRAVLAQLKATVMDFGYDVITANSGIEALKIIKDQKPDCILTDYEMDGMTGPEFCKKIKSEESLWDIPIVLLTSKEDDESIIIGISQGADDFINKSVKTSILEVKIKAMLRIKFLRDELIKLRKLATIRAVIVTYNHEINNALMATSGILRKIETAHPEMAIEDLNKLKGNLKKIQDVVVQLSNNQNLHEREYNNNTETALFDILKKEP